MESHGFFRRPGSLHIHVDGVHEIFTMAPLLENLRAMGFPSRAHRVLDWVQGKERSLMPEVYEQHTPVFNGKEEFNFFSTTLLHTRDDISRVLPFLQAQLRNFPGTILEYEQVIGEMDTKGNWRKAEANGKDAAEDAPHIEIHHAIDIGADEKPRGVLPELETLEQLPFPVGGWFRFKKGDTAAYRSNSFSTPSQYQDRVEREREALLRLEIPVRTLVEKVLGIWKI